MLNISFDFDESTHKVSNLKVTNKEVPELKITGPYDLRVLGNTIQLTSDAVSKLGASTGDRIAINYWYNGNSDSYPIISKAEIFTDGMSGNKLAKSKTFAFRGEQRETLLKYGSVFSFEQWRDKTGKVKDGVFKLIPVKEDDSHSEEDIVRFEEAAIESITQKEIEDDAEWLMSL